MCVYMYICTDICAYIYIYVCVCVYRYIREFQLSIANFPPYGSYISSLSPLKTIKQAYRALHKTLMPYVT